MLLANHCATDKIYIVDRTRCLIEETKKNMVALVEWSKLLIVISVLTVSGCCTSSMVTDSNYAERLLRRQSTETGSVGVKGKSMAAGIARPSCLHSYILRHAHACVCTVQLWHTSTAHNTQHALKCFIETIMHATVDAWIIDRLTEIEDWRIRIYCHFSCRST